MSQTENMNIPAEAVEALACVLAHEALVEADMAGAGWDAENDSPEPFMPRARERARSYLEAAAPYMLAGLAESRVVEDGAELFRFTWDQREWMRSQ